MFLNKHRDKFRLEKKSSNRIPTRWKFVIAGLIGSGTGLLILSMWSPGSKEDSTTTENTNVPLLGRISRFYSQENEKMTGSCKIGSCQTVTCSSISESDDPGQFASIFITQKFAVQCPTTNLIEQLEFQYCTFPYKKLGVDWLTIKTPIRQLSFRDCGLEDLPEGSFSSNIYSDLQSLAITGGRVKILNKWTFQELTNLKQFLLTDNTLEKAEMNLLSPVADSLEDLGLDASLMNIKLLENITGDVSLRRVKNLYLRRNDLVKISSETFKSLSNVVSIYLAGSSISEMHIESLKSTRSLEQLYLNDNSLTNLPRGIFNPILSKNPQFKVSLSNNPWHCSCDFEWMFNLTITSPQIFRDTPTCETPERNALLPLTSATFCDHSNSDFTTTLKTTTRQNVSNEQDDEKSETYVKFTCENYESVRASTRKLFATEEWKFPSRHQDFSVRSLASGDVEINLKVSDDQRVSLIWFENNEISANSSTEKIDCLRNVRAPLLLKNLATDSSYTICLLDNLKESPSPLNCLAARTLPTNATTRSNVWLTNEDKSVVISVAVSLFLIVSLLSAVSSFFLIRKNPSLLRGSKRIVIVKKRGIDALVMPKGTSFNCLGDKKLETSRKWSNERCLKSHYESNYLTPLKNQRSITDQKYSCSTSSPRRKDSKISRASSLYSAGSYVSGIEATPSELYNWRNTLNSKSLYAACIEDEEFDELPPTPPPLPLRAFNSSVPSLSLAVDSDNHSDAFVHF